MDHGLEEQSERVGRLIGLMGLEGFADISARNLLDAIEASKSGRPVLVGVPDERWGEVVEWKCEHDDVRRARPRRPDRRAQRRRQPVPQATRTGQVQAHRQAVRRVRAAELSSRYVAAAAPEADVA